MPYNFVAGSCHTKKLCSKQTFFKRSTILDGNPPFCVFLIFWSPDIATYDDHHRLIGKRMFIELFSLDVTAEALRSNIGSKSAISFKGRKVDAKFKVEWVFSHQPFFLSEN